MIHVLRPRLRAKLQEKVMKIIYDSRPNRKGGFCKELVCEEGCVQVAESILAMLEAELFNEVCRAASDKTYEDLFGDV